MSGHNNRKILYFSIFAFLLFLFCYFRLNPIVNQTVPYTFDQGRDFLKAEEIIRDKNLTFIGPTTGIQGIFHGAWWYYLLVIPYLIFQGKPIGFYFFIFSLSLFPTVFFSLFIAKRFNYLTALFFLFAVTFSSYFISTAIFPINSILALPFILLLLYSTYELFKTERLTYHFLIFLSLGFVLEAEVPFGLFLIPAYFITILTAGERRSFTSSLKKVFYSAFGLTIPLLPRLLFELKNNFSQTRAILGFLSKPQYHNPKVFQEVFFERANYFWGYYKSVFFNGEVIVGLSILILLIIGLFLNHKKLTKINKRYLKFTGLLLIPLFILSLFYKDNFWANYFEGLSYFFLILLIPSFYTLTKSANKLSKGIPILILMILFLIAFKNIYSDFTSQKGTSIGGLKEHIESVHYIFSENKGKELCIKVYTPPVIPFTYNYLFNYYTSKHRYPYPKTEFINNQCWYIIEHDDYAERVANWRKENIPDSAIKQSSKAITKNVVVELWKL